MNLDQILALLELEVRKGRDWDEEREFQRVLSSVLDALDRDDLARVVALATRFEKEEFAEALAKAYDSESLY